MLRVMLKTPLNTATGYGHDGVGLAMALERAGCYVMLSPVTLAPPIPPEVAYMLTRPLDPPFDLLIHHIDPAQIRLTQGERRASHKTVVWTMWEFLNMKTDWAGELAANLSGFDHVIGYDSTTLHALLPFCHDNATVSTLQGGYDPQPWGEPFARDWSGPIRFGMAGVLNGRKNPYAAVRAFEVVHEAYPDTELHLKTNDRTLHPMMEQRYPGLKIHYAFWSHAQMLGFYRDIHAYVGPSFGEGKNLPAIEAATTGAVPIVSDCGGHRMWADPAWAYLTPGTIEPIDESGLLGVKVDEDVLAQQMIHVIEHRDEARAKGEIAARTLPPMMNWDRVVANLLDIVR